MSDNFLIDFFDHFSLYQGTGSVAKGTVANLLGLNVVNDWTNGSVEVCFISADKCVMIILSAISN